MAGTCRRVRVMRRCTKSVSKRHKAQLLFAVLSASVDPCSWEDNNVASNTINVLCVYESRRNGKHEICVHSDLTRNPKCL